MQKTIRICHIISGGLWAGAEVVVYNLLKELSVQKDIKVSAILFCEGRLAEELRRLNIDIVVYDEIDLSPIKLLGRLRQYFLNNRTDIIHSHGYKENILSCFSSQGISHAKRIATLHGMPERYGANQKNARYKLFSLLNFFLIKTSFNAVVPVSQDLWQHLIASGFPSGKLKIIHNGIIIPEHFNSQASDANCVFGSAGRMVPVKDYALYVEVARIVMMGAPSARFELAGDGPEYAKIKSIINDHSLGPRFLLKGFQNNINTFLEGIDVYLNTSIHEGIPLSVLEAMSLGIPIIAPNVGGLNEIIDDQVQGFLVSGREAETFAARCRALIDNPSLREKMALAARRKVIEKFSVGRMAGDYHELYLMLSS